MSVTTPDRPADASTRAALRALPRSSGGALRLAMAVLLATDLVGGLLAVRAGVNTWGEAWGPEALLAVTTAVGALAIRRTVAALAR